MSTDEVSPPTASDDARCARRPAGCAYARQGADFTAPGSTGQAMRFETVRRMRCDRCDRCDKVTMHNVTLYGDEGREVSYCTECRK